MGAIYKMVEIESDGVRRYTAKRSTGKNSMPGAKQIFRFPDHDVVGRSTECPEGSQALLQPVIYGGRPIQPLAGVRQARERAAAALAQLPPAIRQIEPSEPYPVQYSALLLELDKTI
jgi:nicotinate phosphoribosyltransferase